MDSYAPLYILTWNPRKFIWDDYEEVRKIAENKGEVMLEWSVRSKKPQKGDRFILLMQGMKDLNGIVGYGYFAKDPEEYSALSTYDTPFGTRFAKISFKKLVNFATGNYVKVKDLKALFPDQCWSPQMSGIRVWSKYVPKVWTMIGENNG